MMNISSNNSTAITQGSNMTIQNFQIIRTINKGAFAQVYEALDTITKRTLALKIQKMDQMFYTEVKIMKSLRKYKISVLVFITHFISGFPQLHQYGSIDEDFGFIAMELLGPNSLEVLRKIEQRKQKERSYGLPLASIIAIAVKLIGSLQGMHETGYLHSDVKPNNVVFEQYSEIEDFFLLDQRGLVQLNDKAQVYLLDFGLSETYLNQDGSHIQYDKINRQLGNKFFMSLSQLKKNVSSRRDDLEQLIYTLIFLTKGDLPWSLKRNYSTQDIIKAKSCNRVIDMLFDNIPYQFRQAYDYVKNLAFDEKPEYLMLQNIFKSMLQQLTPDVLARSTLKRPQIVTPKEIEDIFEYERKRTHSLNEFSLNFKAGNQYQSQYNTRQTPLLMKSQTTAFDCTFMPEQCISTSTQISPQSQSQFTRMMPTNYTPEQGTLIPHANAMQMRTHDPKDKDGLATNLNVQTSDDFRNCLNEEQKFNKQSNLNYSEQSKLSARSMTTNASQNTVKNQFTPQSTKTSQMQVNHQPELHQTCIKGT
eukprot:403361510